MLSQHHSHAVADHSPTSRTAANRTSVPSGLVLLVESASFFAAALVHRSMPSSLHEATYARIVEFLIGTLLVLGAVGSWLSPNRASSIALRVQASAIFGTSLGMLAIAVAMSSTQSAPDLVFNAGVLLLLNLGLVLLSTGHHSE